MFRQMRHEDIAGPLFQSSDVSYLTEIKVADLIAEKTNRRERKVRWAVIPIYVFFQH